MSHARSKFEPSPSNPDRLIPPDLAALAATLQETAQALLALSQPGMTDEPKEPAVKPDVGTDAGLFASPPAKPAATPPVNPSVNPPAEPSVNPPAKPPINPLAGPSARQADGETRSFYFPPAAVHMERELLRKYRAENFQGLLEEAHTLLVGLVKVMRSVHKDVRVKGYVISSLGAQIDHASALVLRMRHAYEKVMPIQQ